MTASELEELKSRCKNAFLAGSKLADVARLHRINYRKLRQWKDSENWDELRSLAQQDHEIILNSDQSELLQKSGDEISKALFLMSRQGVRELQANEDPRQFPIKAITDAIDKLRRLQMFVDAGGVTKNANLNIDVSTEMLKEAIMEACIEVERKYPEANSKEMIKNIFNNHLKNILDKVK